MADRVAIFIDGGYLDKLIRNEFGRCKIQYDKLSAGIAQGSEILRTYYYTCPPYQSNPPTAEEKQRTMASNRFHTYLSRLSRFQVRMGKLARRGQQDDGTPIFVQKRVDIMLGVDMVQLAATHQISKAILLAGDSDLTPAIEAVKQYGLLTELWHGPPNTFHLELWESCDERVLITKGFMDGVASGGRF